MEKLPNKDEILDYFKKLNLNIDKKTLDSLDSESTIQLYITLLTKLGFINNKTLIIEFEFVQQKIFTFGNLHDQAVIIVKLLKILKRFFKEIYQDDSFTSYDLFNPTNKRTISFLGKIILFMKFKEQEKEAFKKMKEQYKDSFDQLNESNNELKTLKEELEKIEKRKEIEGQNIMKINEEIKKIQGEKREIQIQIDSNEQVISTLNLNSKEYDNKLNINLNLVKNINEKIKNLSFKIVSSPDKIEALVKQTEDLIDLLNNDLNDISNNLNNLNLLYSNFTELIKGVNNCYSVFEEYGLVNQNLNKSNNNIILKKELIVQKNLEFEKIISEIEQLYKKNNEIKQFIDEGNKNAMENQTKKKSELNNIKQRLNELNNKVSILENDKQNEEKNLMDIDSKIEIIKVSVNNLNKKYLQFMTQLYNYVVNTQKHFEDIREEIFGNINNK